MKTMEWKDTEIGKIPKDWEVKPLGEIFETFPTPSYSRDQLNEGGEIKYLHYGDIHTRFGSVVNVSETSFPSVSSLQARKYKLLCDGDVIMADASEDYDGCGHAIAIHNIGGTKIIAGLHTIPLRQKKAFFEDCYAGYMFAGTLVKKQIEQQAVGTKVYSISYKSINECLLIVPTPKEQRRIATALSDIDMLIASLDKAIVKKRLVKQGAMQQLLTGKKRLKGFDGEWEEVSLGTLGKVIRGVGFDPETDVFKTKGLNCFTLLRANNIQNSLLIFTDVLYVSEEKVSIDQELLIGDILICSANGSKKLVGKSTYVDKNYNHFTFGAFMSVFRCNNKINAKYISYLFQSISYYQQLSNILTGSTINNLSSKDILSLTFMMPKDPIEQYEIGERIRMIDGEISVLIHEREKYLRLKEGMMQELLTGKTRLI